MFLWCVVANFESFVSGISPATGDFISRNALASGFIRNNMVRQPVANARRLMIRLTNLGG
jgi:hypothetical protein